MTLNFTREDQVRQLIESQRTKFIERGTYQRFPPPPPRHIVRPLEAGSPLAFELSNRIEQRMIEHHRAEHAANESTMILVVRGMRADMRNQFRGCFIVHFRFEPLFELAPLLDIALH